MRQVTASKDLTMVIVLPDDHPSAQSSHPPEHNPCAGHFSPEYRENNSSGDTIPETEPVDRPSAFPPLNTIKAGAHKHILPVDSPPPVGQYRQVQLEDTVADLDIHHNLMAHSFGESPSKRHLSTRAGLGKARIKTDSGVPYSPPKKRALHGASRSPASSEMSSQPAVKFMGPVVEDSSMSSTSSVLSSPISLTHHSQSSLQNLSGSSDAQLSSPVKKRRLSKGQQRPGLAYAKRLKHNPLNRGLVPAAAMETLLITSSPERSEVDSISTLDNPRVPVGLPPSPQHDFFKDLEHTATSLRHQLSFNDDSAAGATYSPRASIEEEQTVRVVNKRVYSDGSTRTAEVSSLHYERTTVPITPGPILQYNLDLRPKIQSTSAVTAVEPDTDDMDMDLSPPPESPTRRSRFSPSRLLGRRSKTQTTLSKAKETPPDNAAAPSVSLSPRKKPALRETLSKWTRGYLRHRKAA